MPEISRIDLYTVSLQNYLMNTDEKLALIKRNTKEIIKEDELRKLLDTKKEPAVYIGTAITGRPHIGYFTWAMKMADFIKAGFKVKVLLADVHGALDGTAWNVLEKRYGYYKEIIPVLFECIGADLSKIELVRGSSFQLQPKYFEDLLKMCTYTTVKGAMHSASEVVKLGTSPKLAGLLYPLMQSLDEQYLDVDVQYGGIDQRKILVFAREYLPKVGYKPRIEIMTPLIPGLVGKKMSASDPKSKIDLLDTEKDVKKKINGAFCEEGNIEENGVLSFLEYVIMPLKQDRGEKLEINRPEKFGGNLSFSSYEELETVFAKKDLHPMDLKNALATEVNKLLEPMRKNKEKLEKISSTAY
jgi:tyrosyl-tRNA synthetase